MPLEVGSIINRAAARNFIEGIAKSHGHLPEETLSKITDEKVRAEVVSALFTKDKALGRTIITLAKNLYTSKARFVFELLQNAEDNLYNTAIGAGQIPFVSFQIFPRHIIVECNEDGFTEANVEAICKLGESSKTNAGGYIGEKGIGFKSVFMAAEKVHIQSGPFSFYFQHRKDDSGMGMISPIWQDPEEDLDGPLTRMTLVLHQNTEDAYDLIEEQFRDLQDNLLLFLKKLQQIKVSFHNSNGSCTSTTIYSVEKSNDSNRACLTKKVTKGNHTEEFSNSFHITQYTATNLSKHENRNYSESEERPREDAAANIILGFPLNASGGPLIATQEVFAFLPTGIKCFSFVINTDFDTIANRQGIVTTSKRNRDLQPHIASAFVNGVLQLCKHQTLQYQWMKYLPEANRIEDTFWKEVVSQIKAKLNEAPVLRTQLSESFKPTTSLKTLADLANDDYKQPLFADILADEQYISLKYSVQDLRLLQDYGLQNMPMDAVLRRVKADLESSNSKMKSSKTPDAWHTRAAKLLLFPFDKEWNARIREIRALKLIPTYSIFLGSTVWKSAKEGTGIPSFYFPEVNGMKVPTGLFDNLIDATASKNANRRLLFTKLGARAANVEEVREEIIKKHRFPPFASFSGSPFTVNQIREHLHFLYLSHSREQNKSAYRDVRVMVEPGHLKSPRQDHIFSPESGPFFPMELLKATPAGTEPGSGAPGFSVLFLDQQLWEDFPPIPPGRDDGFQEWLCINAYIRKRIWLFDHGSLTQYCTYVAEHRPEKFLGLLQYNWNQEGNEVLEDSGLMQKLQALKVLCDGDLMVELTHTYLPLQELKTICARFLEEGEVFPFLKLQQEIKRADFGRWEFTERLGVKHNADINVYLTILKEIVIKNNTMARMKNIDRVFKLYETLHAKYLELTANNDDEQIEQMRFAFKEESLILLPTGDADKFCWATQTNCRWDAPQGMMTQHPLKSIYETFSGQQKMSILRPFFKQTLEVGDCKWDDFVDELKNLKRSGCTDVTRITEIYSQLARIWGKSSNRDKMQYKQVFEDLELVFASTNGKWNWYKLSQCLWLSATHIRGRIILSALYANFEDFFLGLGVPTLDIGMIYSELKEMGASDNAAITEVVKAIWTFNSFLQDEVYPPDPKPILDGKLFPVRYPDGLTRLSSAKIEFAIVDRKQLADAFREQVKMLDFTLDDVQRLRPFFQWAGLEARYLSRSVSEVSALDNNIKEPISSAVRDIKKKAHALFRIAFHFGTQQAHNDDSLYHSLKNAEVFETDGISSELHLYQMPDSGQKRLFKVQIARSELHIEEIEGGLKVYVPRDRASQDVCYYSKLPLALTTWMMTSRTVPKIGKVNEAAVRIVNSVLNARGSALPRILEAEGVMDVDFVPDEDYRDPESMTPEEGDLTRGIEDTLREHNNDVQTENEASEQSHTPPSSLGGSQGSAPRMNNPNDGDEADRLSAIATSRAASSLRHLVRPTISPETAQDFSAGTDRDIEGLIGNMGSEYLRIINTTIRTARAFSFPSRGPFNMSGLLNALPTQSMDEVNSTNEYVRFRSSTQIERDKRIGAAGELFVFEILSRLSPSLPNFSLENWQSTIRDYVNIHPEYSDVLAWVGRETADISYSDQNGVLTQFLVDKGYLTPQSLWNGRRPHYFIEVKSTTGPCETPFYMSKNQFQMIQDKSNGESGLDHPEAVYIVFRVFNVGRDTMDMVVYVDPDVWRLKGNLVFKAESWSIVPRHEATSADVRETRQTHQ